MQYPNQPHRRPTTRSFTGRTPQNTSRGPVINARDELEREREMYSAHDPRQSGPTPAQRYAEAQKQNQQHTAGQAQQNYAAGQAQHYTMSGQAQQYNTAGQQRQAYSYNQHPYGATNAATDQIHQTNPQASGHIPQQYAGQNPHASGRMPQQYAGQNPQASGRMPQSAADGTPHFPQEQGPQSRTPHMHNYSASAYSNTANDHHGRGGSTIPRNASAAGYGADHYLNHNKHRGGGFGKKGIIAVACAVAVVAIGVFAFTNYLNTKPVNVTINGQQQTISGDQRSLQGLLNTNTVSVTPGNFVAVDGSVITQGGGTRATATINGNQQDNLDTRLNEGDDVSLTNGTDITEDYTDSDPQPIPHTAEIKGTGAMHLYTQEGSDGEKVTRTGNQSGKTAEITTKDPQNTIVQYYNINTNGDKVIALTFDDGPWATSTKEILDLLDQYNAKATFFTVGNCIKGHEDLVKRAFDSGHEIGTHTRDHAEGSGQGVSLILMSPEERKAEVLDGMQAIKDATGQDASKFFRSPGGNFDSSVASDLDGIVTGEIGWNIDTTDWKRPGADAIAKRIEQVKPGYIVLMHDGGGDRSQTVQALSQALPVLQQEGYRFVTVEELVNSYPYQEGQDQNQ